ncbi:hypothetical protein Q0F99_19535 [Rathayibacter oskolensis]|nr:hypothetical protein [Rathayibacter oskolensis]WKK71518.1 hypothetical protein Q0F99_19535 [Rathayibacter oskolensis]
MSLNDSDRERFARQIGLFGEQGQLRLANARVLVLGAEASARR